MSTAEGVTNYLSVLFSSEAKQNGQVLNFVRRGNTTLYPRSVPASAHSFTLNHGIIQFHCFYKKTHLIGGSFVTILLSFRALGYPFLSIFQPPYNTPAYAKYLRIGPKNRIPSDNAKITPPSKVEASDNLLFNQSIYLPRLFELRDDAFTVSHL